MEIAFTRRRVLTAIAAILYTACGRGLLAAETAQQRVSLEQLNLMETRADEARRLFWRGDYDKASLIFQELTAAMHPSRALYLNELGTCYLATGDYAGAERCFREVGLLLETYVDQRLEKRALSHFGKEEEKVYHGDPYEQSTSLLLLALLLMDKGDYDNAAAACKSAALADADATENRYESDYTLLYLIEARCSLLRGNADDFDSRRRLAAESYRITAPQVRTQYSQRQDLVAQMKMSRSERKQRKILDTDDELQTKLAAADEQLKSASATVDAAAGLGALYRGDYNTLILVPENRSPWKTRIGKDANLVVFQTANVSGPPGEITVDAQTVTAPAVREVADIEFQAITRGGRRMDGILKGKASFRDTTVVLGGIVAEAGGWIGLVGVGVQAIGGAVNPEADARCWQSLPQSYTFYALNLPVGEHTISAKQYVYFESRAPFQRTVKLADTNDVAVVFLPPTLASLYSEPVQSGLKIPERETQPPVAGTGVVIPPPLGLQRIERFMAADNGGQPLAVAPDPKRMMRAVREALKTRGVEAYLAGHEQICSRRQDYVKQSPLAFQLRLANLSKVGARNQGSLQATFDLWLVDTQTGSPRFSQSLTGTCADLKAGPTEGFYRCLDDVLGQFTAAPEFSACLTQPATAATDGK